MKKENYARTIFGILFLVIGLGYLAKVMGILEDFTIFFRGWWTLFIIIPCFSGLVSKENNDKSGYMLGLIIGLVLLLSCQNIIPSDKIWALAVAGVFVAIGIKCIVPKSTRTRISQKVENHFTSDATATDSNGNTVYVDEMGSPNSARTSNGDYDTVGDKIICNATFSGKEVRVDNSVFGGAEINCTFGGVDLYLKNAIINRDVVINVNVIFGGVDILVPENVRVIVEVNPILGGVENGTRSPLGADGNTPTVYIKGNCTFGGVEVK